MRVLIWSYSSFQHNYSSYHLFENIIQALMEEGHEVVLVQKDFDGTVGMPASLRNNSSLFWVNIPVAVDKAAGLVSRLFGDVRYSKEAFKRIKKMKRFDVALVQSNNCPGIPVGLLKKVGIPVVYNEQDIFPANAIACGMIPGGLIGKAAGFLTRRAYRLASAVVTISEDMAETILNDGCKKEKLMIIHNWCRGDRDYLVSDEGNAFLKREGFSSGRYRVVYAGNIGRMQDVGTLVDAAVLLRERDDIEFYIAGDGAWKYRLEERCEKENLTNVKVVPGLPEADSQDVYAAADLNVITLRKGIIHTCLPSKSAACIYSRRPFIATVEENSHAARLFSGIPYGRVVAPSNPIELARAIERCVSTFGSRYLADRFEEGEMVFSSNNAFGYVRALERVGAFKR